MDEATKPCTKCAQIKPLSQFGRRAAKKDGRRSQCRACDAAYAKANSDKILERGNRWRAANRDRVRELDRQRYAANAEAVRERKRNWALDNPDTVRETRRRTQAKHRDKHLERCRAWRAANRQAHRDYVRRYRLENLEAVRDAIARWRTENPDKVIAASRRRRVRLAEAPHVPFTEAQLVQRLSMFAGCWMCGGPKESVDHVKPISKGGAHMLANLRPACKPCNFGKKDRWPFAPASAAAVKQRRAV